MTIYTFSWDLKQPFLQICDAAKSHTGFLFTVTYMKVLATTDKMCAILTQIVLMISHVISAFGTFDYLYFSISVTLVLHFLQE